MFSLVFILLQCLADIHAFYSSTSPGRFTLGVLKLHPWLTRGPAMSGLRSPCAEHHLAQRWNSYWSVLATVLY